MKRKVSGRLFVSWYVSPLYPTMAQQTGRLSLASTSTRAAIRSGHSMLDLQRRIRILCFDLVGFLHLAFAFAPLIRFLLMLLLRAFMFFYRSCRPGVCFISATMRLLFMVYRFCRSTTLVIVCADCDARGVGWEFGWGCIGWLLLPKCQAACLERLRVHRATLPNPRSPASPSCVFSDYVPCLSSICVLVCGADSAPCCRFCVLAFPSHPWVRESATGR